MQNGRQILKFRRQPDGRWLIAAAMFNADDATDSGASARGALAAIERAPGDA
jgi:hypothetical protein